MTLLALASEANAAANRYRDAVNGKTSYSDTIAIANKMLAATDELTSAVADAVATGEPTLS